MACSAAARWRSSSRLPLSAHWRSSRTRTTGWSCDTMVEQPDHGGEEQVSLGVGIGGLRRRKVGDPAGQSRDQSGQFGPVFLDVGEELVLGSVGDVVAERLGEELVGGGEVLLAVAEQHASPAVEGGPRRFGHQGGLAQTGLARDQEHLAPFARRDALGGVGHRLQSRTPGPPPHTGAHSQTAGSGTAPRIAAPPRGSQSTSTVSTGSGRPFRVQLSEGAALVTVAASSHGRHHVGGQDLPALADRTQPGRLDDRVPEVVVVLSG